MFETTTQFSHVHSPSLRKANHQDMNYINWLLVLQSTMYTVTSTLVCTLQYTVHVLSLSH